MGNEAMQAGIYDYRAYDRIWQRVSPELNPYPEVREQDSLCAAEVSAELKATLEEWINDEVSDRCAYLHYARRVSGNTQRIFRQLAADEERHARRLMTIYYLATGSCYRPAIPDCPDMGAAWCALLRKQYHAESCGARRYEEGAAKMPDACLENMVRNMGADERRHAQVFLHLLEKSPLA